MGTEATKKIGKSILVIVDIVLIVITLSAILPLTPNSLSIRNIISIALPGLICINFIIAIFMLFKRKWVLLLFNLLAIIANYNYIGAVVQLRFSENTEKSNIKVATYNVHNFKNDFQGYFAKKISEYMNEKEVDVVCMQEYISLGKFNVDSVNRIFSKYYKYKSVPKDIKGKPAAIGVFSKFPIKRSYFISFPNSSNDAMICDIELSKHHIIRVFNLHLQTTNVAQNSMKSKRTGADVDETVSVIENSLLENMKKRELQAQFIYDLSEKSPYPVIIAGDFNSLPSDFPYHLMGKQYKDGFRECGNGYMYTYKGFWRLLRIDYIFHSPALTGIKYYSEDKSWSDHNPVFMELAYK